MLNFKKAAVYSLLCCLSALLHLLQYFMIRPVVATAAVDSSPSWHTLMSSLVIHSRGRGAARLVQLGQGNRQLSLSLSQPSPL